MNINSIKKLSGNIISLALFYFVFLCSEYMFDNRMAVFTDSNGDHFPFRFKHIAFYEFYCIVCLVYGINDGVFISALSLPV